MTSVMNKDGEEKTEQENIAETFASFFEALYAGDGNWFTGNEGVECVPPVRVEEVRRQLKSIKMRKAADERGMVAELLHESSDRVTEVIAQVFSAVLQPESAIPEYWKASSIKKGDQRLPENYRPICIIPVLYKFFSRVLSERIKHKLVEEQSPDQAGFRSNYSCDDHLFAIALVAQKCNEYNIPMCVALLDFKKAFDSISHESI